jgi:hypothetical protein
MVLCVFVGASNMVLLCKDLCTVIARIYQPKVKTSINPECISVRVPNKKRWVLRLMYL